MRHISPRGHSKGSTGSGENTCEQDCIRFLLGSGAYFEACDAEALDDVSFRFWQWDSWLWELPLGERLHEEKWHKRARTHAVPMIAVTTQDLR